MTRILLFSCLKIFPITLWFHNDYSDCNVIIQVLLNITLVYESFFLIFRGSFLSSSLWTEYEHVLLGLWSGFWFAELAVSAFSCLSPPMYSCNELRASIDLFFMEGAYSLIFPFCPLYALLDHCPPLSECFMDDECETGKQDWTGCLGHYFTSTLYWWFWQTYVVYLRHLKTNLV